MFKVFLMGVSMNPEEASAKIVKDGFCDVLFDSPNMGVICRFRNGQVSAIKISRLDPKVFEPLTEKEFFSLVAESPLPKSVEQMVDLVCGIEKRHYVPFSSKDKQDLLSRMK